MSNLAKRIISASVLLPPVIAIVVFAPPFAFTLFMLLLSALAGFELASMAFVSSFRAGRLHAAWLSALVCLSVGSLGLSPFFIDLGLPFSAYAAYVPAAVLVLLVPISSLLFMFHSKEPSKSVHAASFCVFGAAYAGGLFGTISLIRSLSSDGSSWVLLLAACTFLGDTLAYTFGRLFGKRKLAPSISPNKTWAGAGGGVLGSMISVLVAKLTFLPSLELYDVLLLGFPLSVFCQVGDLAESFMKRGFGVKDSGSIIPGHGGILDRCDALMFGAPVVLVFSLLR